MDGVFLGICVCKLLLQPATLGHSFHNHWRQPTVKVVQFLTTIDTIGLSSGSTRPLTSTFCVFPSSRADFHPTSRQLGVDTFAGVLARDDTFSHWHRFAMMCDFHLPPGSVNFCF